MAREHPGNGNYSVNYDVFNCNDGVAPEAGMSWRTESGTWEWDDLNINADLIPEICQKKYAMLLKIIFVLFAGVRIALTFVRIKGTSN